MRGLTPKLVRRALIPAGYLVFLGGLLISGVVFYRGKPFDPKAAVLSDLESPDDNPHGYGAAAAGTAICGVLLIPVAATFCMRLWRRRPLLTLAGAVWFAIGLGSSIAIGLLAPFTHGYTPLHVQLAYAAFAGICAGTLIHLVAAGAPRRLIALQSAAFLFLIYLYFAPDFFSNDRLLTSLAFWEWVLCADCGVSLWMLAHHIDA